MIFAEQQMPPHNRPWREISKSKNARTKATFEIFSNLKILC